MAKILSMPAGSAVTPISIQETLTGVSSSNPYSKSVPNLNAGGLTIVCSVETDASTVVALDKTSATLLVNGVSVQGTSSGSGRTATYTFNTAVPANAAIIFTLEVSGTAAVFTGTFELNN